MTTARILKLDEAIAKFLAGLEWPGDVRPPAVDAVLVNGSEVKLRYTLVAGAPAEAPADFATLGESPWDMIVALATLAEAWSRRHGESPGVYPTGIKAQIIARLDMRTAAAWLYSVQLAAALAVASRAL